MKPPPHNKKLEQSVLKTMMFSRKNINDALVYNKQEHYFDLKNQMIYNAIIRLFVKNVKIDIITMKTELESMGELENVIAELMIIENVPLALPIEYSCLVLIEYYLRREIIKNCMKYEDKANDLSENILDNLQELQFEIINLTSNITVNTIFNTSGLIKSWNERTAKLINKEIHKIKIYLQGLRSYLCYFNEADLIIIAGRPAMGKTSLMLNFVNDMILKQNLSVGIFSLEMNANSLLNRLISLNTGIPTNKLKNDVLNEEDYQIIEKYFKLIKNKKLFIDDQGGLNEMQIYSTAQRWKDLHNIDVIFIDYLQFMSCSQKGLNQEQSVAMITQKLKTLAKTLNIPVFCLSQLNRDSTKRPDKRPALADLRYSGCLHGDTLIQCPSLNRTFRVKDLLDQTNFNIFATNYKSIEETAAKKCFKTGKKSVYKITLLNGQSIIATKKHKFLKETGWVELNRLGIGNKIAIPINYNSSKNNISKYEVSIVGHFLANGCTLKRHAITYCCNMKDTDLTNIVINDAIQATNKKVNPYYKDTVLPNSKFRTIFFKPTFHLTHGKTSPIADIMRKYNIFDLRAKQKYIPDLMFYLSKKKTAILLKSLFSGDGTAHYSEKGNRKRLHLSYSSASINLIFGVQQLLLKIGIVSFIYKLKNKKNQKWYNLNISGKSNIEIFVKNVGFWNSRKNDIMLNGWEQIKNNLAGWLKYRFNESRTLCFMPIKEIIDYGESDVYDIEVPQLHNFIANNIVVHNSIEQDADIVIFTHIPSKADIKTYKDGSDTKGTAELIIAKHRDGATGMSRVAFIDTLTKFSDLEMQISENSIQNYEPVEHFQETDAAF